MKYELYLFGSGIVLLLLISLIAIVFPVFIPYGFTVWAILWILTIIYLANRLKG